MNSINKTMNYNNQIAFSADQAKNKQSTAIAAVKMSDIKDQADMSTNKTPQNEKKEGFNPVQMFNNFASGCKKLWIGACEYTGATVGGIAKGLLLTVASGLGLVGLEKLKNNVDFVKKFAENKAVSVAKSESKGTIQIILGVTKKIISAPAKFILNHIPKNNVNKAIIAGGIGLIPLASSLYNASLNVSEKTAQVDHRFNTGHRTEK